MDLLKIFLVLIFIYPAEASLKNLALGMPTNQSSGTSGGVSSRAVDGNKNTKWSGLSCTHTNKDGPAWWSVNLTAEFVIEQVIVYYRDDCCVDYLDGANVYVDDVLCDKIRFLSLNPVIVKCPSMIGSRVSIYLLKVLSLMLCEVEVMGHDLHPDFINLDIPIHHIHLEHGEDLDFAVKMSYPKGFPHPSLSIFPSSVSLFIKDHSLIVRNASKELQGGYALTAISGQMSVSKLIILQISGKYPEFVGLVSHINTPQLVKFEITATAVGSPAPVMSLRKILSISKEVLFVDVKSSQMSGVTVLSYVLDAPDDSDSGTYIISAHNEYGLNETEIIVKVGSDTLNPLNLISLPSVCLALVVSCLYIFYQKIETIIESVHLLKCKVYKEIEGLESKADSSKREIKEIERDTEEITEAVKDCSRKVDGLLTRLNEIERDVMVINKSPEPPAYSGPAYAGPAYAGPEYAESNYSGSKCTRLDSFDNDGDEVEYSNILKPG